jgi:hypothetical protein
MIELAALIDGGGLPGHGRETAAARPLPPPNATAEPAGSPKNPSGTPGLVKEGLHGLEQF